MQLQVWIFVAALMPALIASQSLVLIGGGLSDNNAIVWEKVVELAVRISNNKSYLISFIVKKKRVKFIYRVERVKLTLDSSRLLQRIHSTLTCTTMICS